MADNDTEQLDDDAPVTISGKDLKALRSIAKDFGDLKRDAEQANRQLAFAKAKIDVTDPKMGYFIKGYEGDLDPNKIREAAEQAGFIAAGGQRVEIPASELGGHQTMSDAASGGSNKKEDLADRIRNATSQEEVMAIMTEAGYPTSWSSQ